MAMLAEPKRKQKSSSDPRNTNWANDTSRFGYQMLSKMGWESGKGLGAKENGITTHVKAVKRKDNLGLGAEKSNENNWLSHQLAFDDMLSQLNQHAENGIEEDGVKKKRKKHEMEKTARQSRKRVFYNRYIQSKDLSSKSAEDIACIFGQRSKSAPGTPRVQSEDEESNTSTKSCPAQVLHGVQTINSGQNIQQYFEKKMKEMKAARARVEAVADTKKEQTTCHGTEESNPRNEELGKEEAISRKKKKDRKRKRRTEAKDGDLESSDRISCFGRDKCSVKKEKKTLLDNVKYEEDVPCEVQEIGRKERRKKKRVRSVVENDDVG